MSTLSRPLLSYVLFRGSMFAIVIVKILTVTETVYAMEHLRIIELNPVAAVLFTGLGLQGTFFVTVIMLSVILYVSLRCAKFIWNKHTLDTDRIMIVLSIAFIAALLLASIDWSIDTLQLLAFWTT